ncbi:MAG: hypothetical protein DGJ47_000400 [Rickettsiaceae bacterium]
MFKFLTLGITVLLLYLGFLYVSDFDSIVQIFVYDLKIELSFFTIITTFFLLQFILIVVIKILSVLLNIPELFKKSWQQHRIQTTHTKLMNAIIFFITDRTEKSAKIARKIYSKIENEGKDLSNIIIAADEKNIVAKRDYYTKALENEYLHAHAAKHIAKIYLHENQYVKAEKFALKCFDKNETDKENIMTLLEIYVALKAWDKFCALSSRLSYADKNDRNRKIVSDHLYQQSQELIDNNKDSEAKEYLKKALSIKPDHIMCLNLYTKMEINSNNSSEALKILKSAFIYNNCFKIALMYAKCSTGSNEVIYRTLSADVEVKDNIHIFLSLAAYLELDSKVKELRNIA